MSAAEQQPNPYKEASGKARSWWRSLQPVFEDGQPNPDGDRAALARLRRAGTVAEGMAEEATHDLFGRLGHSCFDARHFPRAAVVAMVLAHVRADPKPGEKGRRPTAARTVGRTSMGDPDSALMKPLRFRRLLACRDDEDLAREMRRLVALAGETVDVGDLARSILYWNDATRARWAFDYYAPGRPAPDTSATTPDSDEDARP